jgi:hypothetical protein
MYDVHPNYDKSYSLKSCAQATERCAPAAPGSRSEAEAVGRRLQAVDTY